MTYSLRSLSDFVEKSLSISFDEFKKNYQDTQYFYNLLSDFTLDPCLYDLDYILELLCCLDVERKHLRIVKNQVHFDGQLPPQNHLRRLLFEDLYSDGYSFIISSIHLYSQIFGEVAFRLSNLTFSDVDLNLYITPPDSTALVPHYDTHDVFSLQLSGFKRWFFYDFYSKPLVGSFQPRLKVDLWDDMVDACSNSCLYIPRGLSHSARTLERPSVHLTLSFYRLQNLDLYAAQLRYLAELKGVNSSLVDFVDFDDNYSTFHSANDSNPSDFNFKSGTMLNLKPPLHKDFYKPIFMSKSPWSSYLRLESTTSSFSLSVKSLHSMIFIHEIDSAGIIFDFHSKVILPKALRDQYPVYYNSIISLFPSFSSSSTTINLELNLPHHQLLWKFLRRLCYSSLIALDYV